MQLMIRAGKRREGTKSRGTWIDWQWVLIDYLNVLKKFKTGFMG